MHSRYLKQVCLNNIIILYFHTYGHKNVQSILFFNLCCISSCIHISFSCFSHAPPPQKWSPFPEISIFCLFDTLPFLIFYIAFCEFSDSYFFFSVWVCYFANFLNWLPVSVVIFPLRHYTLVSWHWLLRTGRPWLGLMQLRILNITLECKHWGLYIFLLKCRFNCIPLIFMEFKVNFILKLFYTVYVSPENSMQVEIVAMILIPECLPRLAMWPVQGLSS